MATPTHQALVTKCFILSASDAPLGDYCQKQDEREGSWGEREGAEEGGEVSPRVYLVSTGGVNWNWRTSHCYIRVTNPNNTFSQTPTCTTVMQTGIHTSETSQLVCDGHVHACSRVWSSFCMPKCSSSCIRLHDMRIAAWTIVLLIVYNIDVCFVTSLLVFLLGIIVHK